MQSKLGRKKGHRDQVIANLATSLILHEKIDTTIIKAKTVAPFIDRIFSITKKDDLAARRYVTSILKDKKAVSKLFTQALPNIKSMTSGFSSIYKIQPRRGDGAPMATIVLNEKIFKIKKLSTKAKSADNIENKTPDNTQKVSQ
jgi:large subunit ribosomal protein L17